MLQINDKEFESLKALMYEKTGVFLKDTKKPLIIARLRRRLQDLNLGTFGQYYDYLKNPVNREIEFFVNAITTNETFFFRTEGHFKFLNETFLPEAVRENNKVIKIWSAACSTGEEPYSIAISILEFLKGARNWNIRIFASDINSQVLEEAKQGLYRENKFRATSLDVVKRYFVEEKGEKYSQFRLKDEVKQLVSFKLHNLKNVFSEKKMDIIFLRNVMIYFDKPMKMKVIGNIVESLKMGGHLVLGPSEGMLGFETDFNLKYVAPSIFIKE